MHVYIQPSGFLGWLVGRALRFRVHDFTYTLGGKDGELRHVEVVADSLIPECEVHRDTLNERLGLTYSETGRVLRRMRGFVLETQQYPLVEYEVTEETTTHIDGRLTLHGVERPVRCTKVVEGTDVVVRCPVTLGGHQMKPYKLWLGLFSVKDEVQVVTRVPASALKL